MGDKDCTAFQEINSKAQTVHEMEEPQVFIFLALLTSSFFFFLTKRTP